MTRFPPAAAGHWHCWTHRLLLSLACGYCVSMDPARDRRRREELPLYERLREARKELQANRAQLAARTHQVQASSAELLQTVKTAGTTLDNTRLSRFDRELLRHSDIARLVARLRTMPVIEQAKGIIVSQSRCTPEQAFRLLRQASQRNNIPVRDLAAAIVERNSSPEAPGQVQPQPAPKAPLNRTQPAAARVRQQAIQPPGG